MSLLDNVLVSMNLLDEDEEVCDPIEITDNKKQPLLLFLNKHFGDAGIVCIHIKTFIDSREVVDTVVENNVVLISIEGFQDKEQAQRVIDFVAGAVYALDGTFQRISDVVFIASPGTVDIYGDVAR